MFIRILKYSEERKGSCVFTIKYICFPLFPSKISVLLRKFLNKYFYQSNISYKHKILTRILIKTESTDPFYEQRYNTL